MPAFVLTQPGSAWYFLVNREGWEAHIDSGFSGMWKRRELRRKHARFTSNSLQNSFWRVVLRVCALALCRLGDRQGIARDLGDLGW